MSKSVFNNSISNLQRIYTFNQFIYITTSGSLLQRLDMTNGTLINNYATINSNISGNSYGQMCSDGTYIYIPTDSLPHKIFRLDPINNTILNWINLSGAVSGSTIIGDFLYISMGSYQEIRRINLSTLALTTVASIENPGGLTTDGTYLYVDFHNYTKYGNSNRRSIARVDLTNNSVILDWAEPNFDNASFSCEIINFGNFIYQALNGSDRIVQINKTTKFINSDYSTTFGGNGPQSITTDGTFGYVSNGGSIIHKLTLEGLSAPPAPTTLSYDTTTKLLTWRGLVPFDSFVIQDLSKGLDVSSNTQSFDLTSFFSLDPSITLNVTVKQVTDGLIGTSSNIFTISPSTPMSNICFPKDIPITTDQGIIPIQDITNQTINGLKVDYVTQIIGSDNHLVCFEKDALYPGCPSEKTVMTRNHKVCYNGEMVEAETLLNKNIYLVSYNGEKLYNVLLEENGTMNVNNLLCETLDVNNVIARFYKSKYTSQEKSKITQILNNNYGTPNYKVIAGLFFGHHLDNRLKLEM